MMRVVLPLLAFLTATGAAAEFTIASFNIRYASRGDLGAKAWKNRRDLVVETVRKIDPDVFGVQEALAHQMAFLQTNLPEYEAFGVGRDDGKRKGEFSAIFLRKERLKRDPDQGGTFWMSDTPDKAGTKGWGNEVIRICTWSRLVDKKTGKGFYLYNTHWDHRSQPSREQSARLMASRADQRKNKDEPVVLIGDFNATERNPGVAYLLGNPVKLAGGKEVEQWKNPLRSTLLELHPNLEDRRTFNGWRPGRTGTGTIDHVLVSKEWKIRKAWIEDHHKGEMVPSDHWPVAAVVALDD